MFHNDIIYNVIMKHAYVMNYTQFFMNFCYNNNEKKNFYHLRWTEKG